MSITFASVLADLSSLRACEDPQQAEALLQQGQVEEKANDSLELVRGVLKQRQRLLELARLNTIDSGKVTQQRRLQQIRQRLTEEMHALGES